MEDINKMNKAQRTQLWGDVDDAVQYHGTKSACEIEFLTNTADDVDEEKQERIQQMKEILSILSPREKEYFVLKHEAMLTEEECAEKLNLELGTIKSMSQRIRNKIECYFNGPHQTSLFFD